MELNHPEKQEKLDEYQMICLAPQQNEETLADITRRGFEIRVCLCTTNDNKMGTNVVPINFSFPQFG